MKMLDEIKCLESIKKRSNIEVKMDELQIQISKLDNNVCVLLNKINMVMSQSKITNVVKDSVPGEPLCELADLLQNYIDKIVEQNNKIVDAIDRVEL